MYELQQLGWYSFQQLSLTVASGNPTRSYRSEAPLKIIGEVQQGIGQTPGEIQKFRDKLANNKGEIIN